MILQQIELELLNLMKKNNIENLVSSIVDEELVNTVYEDLTAFAQKDPAAHENVDYVFHTYSSFRAVMYYRLANQLYYHDLNDKGLRYRAKEIAEEAKLNTGIEIHPAASIGRRFVVDHGIGTVVGETTIIGDDCYILQCVILGAAGIANNASKKRHPTLCNNVEVGAFARILGNVRIGNNVKISPYAIIRQDVCDNHNVILVSQCQIVKKRDRGEVLPLGISLGEQVSE